MFYFITIASATLLIALLNLLLDGLWSLYAYGEHLLFTTLGVAAVIAVDGILAFILRRLPEKWFLPEAKIFSVGIKERNFYRKIKIQIWKKHVPEWGCFTGFHKDKVQSPNDSTYLGRFLLESNYGVAGHVGGALFGYAILLLPFLRPLTMGLPIAVVNMILSWLPVMVLRSNTMPLRKLYRRSLEREEHQARIEKDALASVPEPASRT
ncbi:MAG: hypothetical protein IJX28_07345 [Clostridia bacterium]|nr:hypothetical protein [Clostridia bacterium]